MSVSRNLVRIGVSKLAHSGEFSEEDPERYFDFEMSHYITEVIVQSSGAQYFVDSIPLIYDILEWIPAVPILKEIMVEIGEGLEFSAVVDSDNEDILICELGADGFHKDPVRMTRAQMMLFLVVVVSDLDSSLLRLGVDILPLLTKFPPSLKAHLE